VTERANPARPSPHPVPAPAGVGGPAGTHGFLFADLRDYTRYVDTHGDRAAVALLERYRLLVRGAVAEGNGAEIRTEGDSFYVVFDSVSAAVRCGMAIVEAAGATAEGPADPIHVGVGVHAGETIETAEGFVGSAVNIAARLCAEAKAGELVVSDTVRALTRASLEVEFEPLGARRLKGIEEPVACYRVVSRGATAHAPDARPVGRRPSRLLAAGLGAAAVVAIIAGGAVVLTGWGHSAAPTPGPSAAAAAAGPAGAPASVSPAASTAAPTAPPTLGPFPNETESAILAALPPNLAKTCVRGGTANDARLAGFTGLIRGYAPAYYPAPAPVISVAPKESRGGVTCHPTSGAMRLYVMAPVQHDLADASEYIGYLSSLRDLIAGSCATENDAHELWTGPRGSGLLACMNPYDGRPWIYFSFAKGRYLAFATRDDSDYDALHTWWDQLKTFLP
jgi:class 3 adenylate cyclase